MILRLSLKQFATTATTATAAVLASRVSYSIILNRSYLQYTAVACNGRLACNRMRFPVCHGQTILVRAFSLTCDRSQKVKEPTNQQSSIIQSDDKNDQISTHHSPIRKQAATDMTNVIVIMVGAAIVGAIFYYLFIELFSRETPSGIYNESSKKCLENFEVQEALGHPIKVTAESGGRRVFQIKHYTRLILRHKLYIEDGVVTMMINYYLSGPQNKGIVVVKCKKNNETKRFEYEHIVVKLDYKYRGRDRIYVLDKESDKIKSIY